MNRYIATIEALISEPLTDDEARLLSIAWADELGARRGACNLTDHGTRIHFQAAAGEYDDVRPLLTSATHALEIELQHIGRRITDWVTVEIATEQAITRRALAIQLPALVDADEFAEILGVDRSRVYQLEAARRRGQEDTHFPAPLRGRIWLRSVAEHYRNTRRAARAATA